MLASSPPSRARARPILLLAAAACIGSCGGEENRTKPPSTTEIHRLLETEQAEEAFEQLRPIVKQKGASRENLILFAEACRQLGRIRRGVRSIERALAQNPEDPEALRVSALLDRDRHHPADALASIRRATQLAPGDRDSFLLLGELLLQAGDPEGAAEAFRRARELAPADPRAVLGLAQSLVQAGRHEEGLPLLEVHLTRNPRDGEALYLRGLCRFRQKDFAAAERDFLRAIELAPYLPGPYYNLARIFQTTGRAEEAAAMRERHRQANERDWAIRSARRQLLETPNDPKAADELARLLEEAGRHEEAARVRHRVQAHGIPAGPPR